jgi:hypothetical protein
MQGVSVQENGNPTRNLGERCQQEEEDNYLQQQGRIAKTRKGCIALCRGLEIRIRPSKKNDMTFNCKLFQ